ncbi:hypothetical protein PFICI_06536 [Pestalotiopsis fici W106-1]|uniref:Zn(2)-C6 fungal-type domain-containing protein n=1 Tax=Pestalotiopsis fici (strain W106-1 / CGMCC3.15140) TaxID=1229662 RepID=W3X669_PESFW|nr:uncharacterized protein PFICI_06536 [Pestalotiopsis fici W106-1]ETS81534.1 hypothetical protein PFICI_06536 [Pestalotiopsis fici W106-1]
MLGSTSSSSAANGTSTTGPPDPKRSRLGCWICREKKVKCDEAHPRCGRCVRLARDCSYAPRSRKKYVRRKKSSQLPIPTTPNDCQDDIPTPNSRPAERLDISSSTGYYETFSSQLDALPADQRSQACSHEQRLSVPVATPTPTPTGQVSSRHLYEHHSSPVSVALPDLSLSPACLEILDPSDYDAIRFFRSGLSGAIDTKVPEHSGPAILWTLAHKNQMVLHTVCALGGRNLCNQKHMPDAEKQTRQARAVEHYAAGLRLLVTATEHIHETRDFDYILGALWLMIVYEQKYGDGCGTGLIAHLHGATSLLQSRMRNLRHILEQTELCDPTLSGTAGLGSSIEPQHLSPVATRIIVWISLIDGAAALNGFGGAFNDLLAEAIFDAHSDTALARIQGFSALQKHSNLVYQEVWGTAYPQSQLLEDLESSQLFYLYAEASQLRCFLAKLCRPEAATQLDVRDRFEMVAKAMRNVESRYSELFAAASLLDTPAEGSHKRFVMNVRFIIPFYYAVVLCFFRLTRADAALCAKQRRALQEIMTLAFQSHRDAGTQAVTRMAWPLFIAALESDDALHRGWIVEQFELMAVEGENYRRAREALRIALSEQRPHERRVSYWDVMTKNDVDRFVIV